MIYIQCSYVCIHNIHVYTRNVCVSSLLQKSAAKIELVFESNLTVCRSYRSLPPHVCRLASGNEESFICVTMGWLWLKDR